MGTSFPAVVDAALASIANCAVLFFTGDDHTAASVWINCPLTCSHRWVTRYAIANQRLIYPATKTKPRGKPCFFVKKKKRWWKNVHGVCILQTHATRTKQITEYLTTFRFILFVICSLTNCLQDLTDEPGHRWLIFFQVDHFGNYFFSLCFSFFSIEILPHI